MGAAQPSPAPLQLENLTPAQLLERYCEPHEELYVVALWQRFADLQQRRGEIYNALRWTSRRYCPTGYNPEWDALRQSYESVSPLCSTHRSIYRSARYPAVQTLQAAPRREFRHYC